MMERPAKWRWGALASEQPRLQPLLDALKRLRTAVLLWLGSSSLFTGGGCCR
jgi:hypothetical protein